MDTGIVRYPPLVDESRDDSIKQIKAGIVEGVLEESGLPSLKHIISGNGNVKSRNDLRYGTESKKNGDSLTEVPPEDRPETKQVPGVARYLGSQFHANQFK